MSVSENSTLLPTSREPDGVEPLSFISAAVTSHEESPYTENELVFLDIGANKTRLCLHRPILSQCDALITKITTQQRGATTFETVVLPEVDVPTAHTVVHYLYTGQYQALRIKDSDSENATSGYRRGTCVYCAALRYKLPGLANMAKETITQLGEDLSIVDILKVARDDAFPNLPDEELWYSAYLEGAVTKAVREDKSRTGIIATQIEGHDRYRQVVMGAIVSAVSGEASTTDPQHPSGPAVDEQPEPPATKATPKEVTADYIIPEDAIPVETIPEEAIADETKVHPSEPTVEDALTFDAIDPVAVEAEVPVVPAVKGPEPATDELGWGNSKTFQKYGKKADPVTVAEVVLDKEETRPSHTRTDSAVEVSSPVVDDASPVVEDVTVPLTAADENSLESSTAKKSKNKKNKKKKASATNAPPATNGPSIGNMVNPTASITP